MISREGGRKLKLGISIYTGDNYTHKSNIEYIEMANSLGIRSMFTSLNISSDRNQTEKTMELIKYAKSKGLYTSVDVSSRVFDLLNIKPNDLLAFHDIGIDEIRLDYGFDAKTIAAMSNNDIDMGIVLNASTIEESDIEKLFFNGVNRRNIKACHNFYPRPFTGLSYSYYMKKTTMLQQHGIGVSAFIPSDTGKRGPLYEGLPTIETHRKIPSYIAAKQLIYDNVLDTIYIGDAYAKETELERILGIDPEVIELYVDIFDGASETEEGILLRDYHTNRRDSSEYIVRSAESRGDHISTIEPSNCKEREYGSITVDNVNMGRYMGELQIARADLPSDPRVNVVGKVAKDHMMFLDYIEPGTKFRLIKSK